MTKLRTANKSELKEGMVIYFEYEHHYNHHSSATRYKRGIYLGESREKAIIILQGLHGKTWNNSVTRCDFDRICVESYIGTAEFKEMNNHEHT